MSDVKWIKISTNVFDDEKIKLIETLPDSDTLIIIWFKLLAMAGRCNDSGMIYLTRDVPYNEEMLSTIMRRPVNTVRLAMSEFQKLGMIHIVNNYIAILNWEKHQNVDGLDRIRENTRKRVQNWRKNHKQIPCNVSVTDGNAPEKSRVEKSREDKSKSKDINTVLHNEIIQHFQSINPDYFHNGKHGKAINELITRLKTKDAIINAANKLIKIKKYERSQFWTGCPCTPHDVNARYDQILNYKLPVETREM